MTRRGNHDIRLKRKIFLAAFTIFLVTYMIGMFFGGDEFGGFESDIRLVRIQQGATALLWGVSFLLTISMKKQKILVSKPAKLLASGVSAFIIWSITASFTGLSLRGGNQAMIELIKIGVFASTFFMSAGIIEKYDLKREIICITAFCMGTTLLTGFLTHLGGFPGVSVFVNIFDRHARTRYTFGLSGYNYVGRLCFHFFAMVAMYKTLLNDKYNYSLGWGALIFTHTL